ncbi:hypothetical protein ABBQ32_007646 [Trebouxia sp. C0010 RCD-2024]
MIGGCLSQRSQHCLLHQLSKHALVHLQMKCKPAQQQQKKLRVSSLFTGIVQGKGHVKQVHKQHEFSSINIQFPTGRTDAIQTGASVAINGTCLTVTSQDHDTLTFDIIKETLRATNLGQLQQGSEVNFERCVPCKWCCVRLSAPTRPGSLWCVAYLLWSLSGQHAWGMR